MSQVLDAHAVFVYLEKEPAYEKVRDMLSRAAETGKNLFMSSVNWGEVYYITKREKGEITAEGVMKVLDSFPIEVVDVDKTLARQAGAYKAEKKMSYADCFAAALAKMKKAELITGDKEFREVEGNIKILWL
ncbi:MAG: type II toxin-antitoxin system VapC family toxin [Deltaproteobacteria bacterium]|nr:type II toxin-antitoxin system VapC family toxin [Deltaproteobacteria bacterium]